MTEQLNRVAAAANTARNNAKTLEAKLRDKLKEELSKDSTALDIAAAEAFRSGAKKAAIGRAMGTKDFNTYNDAIDRGLRLIGTTASTASGVSLRFDIDNLLVVNYYGQEAEFEIYYLEGQENPFLNATTPLWDEAYANKNLLVEALDGVSSGALYDEVVAWIRKND